MTAEKFKSICEYKGITWNDLVRIRIIRPKKFLGFFRQLLNTGIIKTLWNFLEMWQPIYGWNIRSLNKEVSCLI